MRTLIGFFCVKYVFCRISATLLFGFDIACLAKKINVMIEYVISLQKEIKKPHHKIDEAVGGIKIYVCS